MLIALLARLIPHQHPGAPAPDHRPAQPPGMTRATALLIALALILHNIPEGMAVGIAAAEGATGTATAVVAAIAIHNVIEGVLVTVPLRLAGMSAAAAFGIGQVRWLRRVRRRPGRRTGGQRRLLADSRRPGLRRRGQALPGLRGALSGSGAT